MKSVSATEISDMGLRTPKRYQRLNPGGIIIQTGDPQYTPAETTENANRMERTEIYESFSS